MFDRIAPVYDVMNRVMTLGLDRRWRRLTVEAVVQPGVARPRRLLRHGRPRRRRGARGRHRHRASTSPARCSPGRGASRPRSSGSRATCWRCPFADGELRRGHGRLRRSQRRRPRGGPARASPRPAPWWPARDPRDHAAAGALKPFFSLWFDRIVPLLGRVLPGGKAYTYLPASVRRFPGAEDLAALIDDDRVRGHALPPLRRLDRRAPHGDRAMSATLDIVRAAPGLADYLDGRRGAARALRRRAPGPRRRDRRRRARRRAASACGRCSRSSRRRPARARRSPPAPRSSSSTWRRSSTTTSSTGPACVGAGRRPGRPTVPTPRGRRATTSSRAPSPSSRRSATSTRVAILADASLALARGEALQRRQRHDPDDDRRRATSSAARSRRASSSRPPACSAAAAATTAGCSASRSRSSTTSSTARATRCETGKIPGTDLRDGTPTLPLLLAAQEDEVVRAAIAGGPLEGVLVRVAATGALERSREVALDYARRARESLAGDVRGGTSSKRSTRRRRRPRAWPQPAASAAGRSARRYSTV